MNANFTGLKGIRKLLGTLNYYRCFVPEMAEYLEPFNKKGQRVAVIPDARSGVSILRLHKTNTARAYGKPKPYG